MPLSDFYWIRFYLEDDETGILSQMAFQMKKWEEEESYLKDWNLADRGVYQRKIVPIDDKVTYIKRNFLRYLDRRLTQYLKKKTYKAYKNSESNRDADSSELLMQESEWNLFSSFKMKIVSKPLAGKISLRFLNPYLALWSDLYAKGDIQINLQKSFRFYTPSSFDTEMNYSYRQGSLTLALSKSLMEGLSLRLSGMAVFHQEKDFDENMEKKVEIRYSKLF